MGRIQALAAVVLLEEVLGARPSCGFMMKFVTWNHM